MAYTNSSLVNYTLLSPHHSGKRTHSIDTISIHCMAGNLSVETCGKLFKNKKASSNYGIGTDGRIALYVEEKNRSWCTSSSSNDNRAITIEVANDGGANTGWHVSDKAFNSLINLLVDICKRNGIKQLRWQGNKNLIGQVSKQNMTVHRWFAAKACPGDYLYKKHSEIANLVNARLNKKEEKKEEKEEEMTQAQFNEMFNVAIKAQFDTLFTNALNSKFNTLFNSAINDYKKTLQDNDASDWSKEAREWAVSTGLVKGGNTLPDGTPNYMWQDSLSREQMATLLYRFKDILNENNQ